MSRCHGLMGLGDGRRRYGLNALSAGNARLNVGGALPADSGTTTGLADQKIWIEMKTKKISEVPKDVAPTKTLLKCFDDLHLEKFGERAVIQGGKDAKLIAALWQSHGEERVKALMAQFFDSEDRFIRENGYTVGMFVSQAAKLIARRPIGRTPVVAAHWRQECREKHGGRCTNSFFHAAMMDETTK